MNNHNHPKLTFSVVISTYNRSQALRDTLVSVSKSTRKPDEVWVIDDGDLSHSFISDVKDIYKKENIPLFYRNKIESGLRRGLSESKNWSSELVSSDIICFLDDDVIIEPDYFFELMKVWEQNASDEKLIGIGGKVINGRTISVLEKIYRSIFGLSAEYSWDVNGVGFQVWDNSVVNIERAYYMEGCSSSYRRDLLREIPFAVFAGGRTALEDVEHCLHAKKEGYHFLYAPDAKLVHHQILIGRDKAFLSGWKEGHNRRYIFNSHIEHDLKHRVWFIWANIGWILKKMIVFKFREAIGMIVGLFSFRKETPKNVVQSLFKDNTVEIFDSSVSVANAVNRLKPRKVTVFVRGVGEANKFGDVIVRAHLVASAPALTVADVCMLDGDSLKVLAVRYPSDARHILARLAIRSGWILGVLGLVRRVILRRVKLGGIVKLTDDNDKNSYWLVINRTKKTSKQERFVIPKSIGVVGLFSWLKSENIEYVVPRFYEKLPELHREGGDLDILVKNESAEKIKDYLRSFADSDSNADSIPIGIHTVSRSSGLPYYPPPLALRIIDRAVDGPAGSKIPAPDDALNSFIYHVLYHGKGYATNIPSTQGGKPETIPENDYGTFIKQKANAIGAKVGETMEDLDEYMGRVGWRPKRDTLAKIAEKNTWVRDRFFNRRDHGGTGLTVFILKEKALSGGLMNGIVDHFRKNGLNIVREAIFTDEQKKLATDHIRGGNWVGPKGDTNGLLPAAMIIATDPQCANLPPAYAGEYERLWSKRRKGKIRSTFDKSGEASVVHAADNTIEAWEYIEYCFPDELETIKKEIESYDSGSHTTKFRRFISITYIIHTIKFRTRDFVTKRL